MIRPKGIDVLMQALRPARGSAALRCEPRSSTARTDADNTEAITADVLTAWCAQHGARWLGHVSRTCARCGGTPTSSCCRRAAARACRARCWRRRRSARPLVVTDVPGCRHFVRDGVEGFIVPPEDAEALADALERLARDPELRLRMGEAARLRLLHGFTEAHVKQSLRAPPTPRCSPAREGS